MVKYSLHSSGSQLCISRIEMFYFFVEQPCYVLQRAEAVFHAYFRSHCSSFKMEFLRVLHSISNSQLGFDAI
ncbi:MAG: hypothetical protein A3D92_20930 [Bacteroidetes bacterium RIFCSPHIGHO2_02_FULL_44_7]|nr:MAG: hypothetical protein A3D92_20930 [Bacteroidetes bacterium RIFCSPHIGHO2_02_FULL_44_7]